MQLKKFDEAAARFESSRARATPSRSSTWDGPTAMGTGVQKDMPKAVEWFRQSAEQGHVEAEAVLGYHYMQGLGVAQSYAEAARWSQRAADKGHGGAAYNLARMYVRGGAGLAGRPGQAEKWAKIAMAKGFPDPLRDRPDQPVRTDGCRRDLQRGREALQGAAT